MRKLGPPPHICLFCALDDPRCLIAKQCSWLKARVPRSVLEKHHVFLEALDADCTVLLCILCHFKVTQGYLQACIDFSSEPNPQRRVALMLRALKQSFYDSSLTEIGSGLNFLTIKGDKIMETKILEVRVHTGILKSPNRKPTSAKPRIPVPEKWSERVLILDCETTTDQSQALLFGSFLYCRAKGNHYFPVLEGTVLCRTTLIQAA